MAETVLRVDRLAKKFRDKEALRRVDMELLRGEIVGFIGPNGAGKSTCLRCLLGLVFRSGGAVDVLGMDPAREALAIRQRCSYLPGETSVYANMTGSQFLDFALSFYEDRHRDLEERMQDTFRLPLKDKVRSYSAGMKQKLALLATFLPDVDLYLFDEPDRALDATTRFFLRQLILELRDRGKTVLLSTHHLAEVESVAHRLVFLVDGRTVAPEEVEEAREQLRHRVRLRVDQGVELPSGHHVVEREPDGTLVLEIDDEPLTWLGRLDPGHVLSVEVGFTRLEDLYQILTRPMPAEGGGRP